MSYSWCVSYTQLRQVLTFALFILPLVLTNILYDIKYAFLHFPVFYPLPHIILWRVRVAPLINVGSWSLISIYWIRLLSLPQLQGFHSSQPILTLSYIMDTVSGLFSSCCSLRGLSHWLLSRLLEDAIVNTLSKGSIAKEKLPTKCVVSP
jgi:hypothetical protein